VELNYGNQKQLMNMEKIFNCGDKDLDMVALIDCAYDMMEIWNPKENEIYNKKLRLAWLKRARELGAVPSM